MEIYDFLIIGAGCAGASGAMYASRLNLKTVMVAKMPGGLITSTHIVENWPGIKNISGTDLANSILDHAASFGVAVKNETVLDITIASLSEEQKKTGVKAGFIVHTGSGEYCAKTILFATGSKHRKLGLPTEQKFENMGLSYCALCDGAFFRDKIVAVVGSGDSAAKEAMLLAEHSAKVYVLSRTYLHPEPINLERVKANKKIELLKGVEVLEILGDDRLRQVKLNNGKILDLDGLFVAIGLLPQSEIAKKIGVELNEKGEIIVNRKAETNLPGIFAAGDVCDGGFKQAITGAAEAITASYWAFDYLNKNEVVF